MTGVRKFWLVIAGLVAELGGLAFVYFGKIELGVFTAFSGAVVAILGLYFKANIDEHKANSGG